MALSGGPMNLGQKIALAMCFVWICLIILIVAMLKGL